MRAQRNGVQEIASSIEVDACGRFVHFVGPLAVFDGGFAGCGGEDARHRRAARQQMRKKAMLFEQPLAIAHACDDGA